MHRDQHWRAALPPHRLSLAFAAQGGPTPQRPSLHCPSLTDSLSNIALELVRNMERFDKSGLGGEGRPCGIHALHSQTLQNDLTTRLPLQPSDRRGRLGPSLIFVGIKICCSRGKLRRKCGNNACLQSAQK